MRLVQVFAAARSFFVNLKKSAWKCVYGGSGMKAEIIAVGTEILLGEIVNTNAQLAAQALAQAGIASQYQTVVGDNPTRLIDAIAIAEGRSDLLILIGGLGPTPDDLTKQTLAQHLAVKLVEDKNAIAKLEAWQQQLNRKMPANNLAQALYLAGGEPLANEVGLAVGCYYKTPDHSYFILPGPPREFSPMLAAEVAPRLPEIAGQPQKIVSKMARFYGLGESFLATQIADIIAQQQNPTIATYLKDYEIGVRVTARATTTDLATAIIEPVMQQITARLAPYFVGYGENQRLPNEVVALLKQAKRTVTAAESLTAGLFQADLASVAGASSVFAGGFVTYANAIKTELLGIPAAVIADQGVVSREVAQQMAERARHLIGSDYGLGFTGVAGPEQLEGQAVGTTYIALARPNEFTIVQEYHFAGLRNEIRQRAALAGFKLLYDELNKS
jgi:nicotinamide-nucleotide amidase